MPRSVFYGVLVLLAGSVAIARGQEIVQLFDRVSPPPPGPTQLQTSYSYVARTTRDVVVSFQAGTLLWRCQDNRCSSQALMALGIEACQSLARVIGSIEAFSRNGVAYSSSQVNQCNLVAAPPPAAPPPPPEVSTTVGLRCTQDSDCDDGVYCNGEEVCVGESTRGVGRCRVLTIDCDDAIACTLDACDEALRSCTHRPPDLDGDGHTDITCRGGDGSGANDDCDDSDPARFPGNPEACDSVDQDCDPATFGTDDSDGDGFIAARCTNTDTVGVTVGGPDCDDRAASINPVAPELCNNLDDDCDGTADEGAPTVTVWFDNDRDGFGDRASGPQDICLIGDVMLGRSLNNYDCDDRVADSLPGADGCPPGD
jgi:hypothetical protein